MKLLLMFLFASFFGGIVLQRLSTRSLMLVLLGMGIVVSIGYYFFNQI
jgi:hypothetical protein